jgi:hypothetical protein
MRTVGLLIILLSILIPTLPPFLLGEVGFVVMPLAFLTIPGCLIGLFMAFDRNGRWLPRRKSKRLMFSRTSNKPVRK